jgi:hypothetical protein
VNYSIYLKRVDWWQHTRQSADIRKPVCRHYSTNVSEEAATTWVSKTFLAKGHPHPLLWAGSQAAFIVRILQT